MATGSFLVSHLAVLVALGLTVGALGCVMFPTVTSGSRLERWALGGVLGLGVLGQAALLLGLFGALRRGPVALLVGTALVGGWWSRRRTVSDRAPRREHLRPRQVAVALAAAAVLAPLFLATLYPPTAFDETLYHLPTARAFAEAGEVRLLPELRVPVFPQLGDLLMATVLLWSDDVAAHLVAFLATLLTAGLLVAWGRRLGGTFGGICAAALFLGNPMVVYLAGTGYIDPELAMFATGGIFALDRWRQTGARAWLVAAGFLAGCAASTKYLGLFFAGVLALGPLLSAPRGRGRHNVVLALLAAAATAAPTYARLVYWTGNPLFPFLPGIFGDSAWAPQAMAIGLGERVRSILTLPWDVVFRRAAVGELPPYSPIYLLGLPLLAVGVWTIAWVRGVILVCAVYLLAVPPNARYALAAAPLASLALAVAGASILKRTVPPRLRSHVCAWALCLILVLPGWLYTGYEFRREGPLPTTAAARETYLLTRLPVYAAIRFLNETRGDRYVAYQMGAEQMQYFARGRLLGDHVGPVRYDRLLTGSPDPEALIQRLRGWDVDYLVVPGEARRVLPANPATWRGLRRVYSDGHAEVFELLSTINQGGDLGGAAVDRRQQHATGHG
jgi:hypothetical protein